MKKSRKIVALGLLGFIAFMILGAILTPAIAGVIVATGTVVSGGAVTEQSVRETSETLDMEDISQQVTLMLPSRTPIDTILRNIRKASQAQAMEHRYYEVGTLAVRDNLDTDVSGAGTSSSVPASAYTYASGTGLASIYIQVLDGSAWSVNDTLLMRDLTLEATAGVPVVGGSDRITSDVMFLVTYKSGNVLRLQPRNGVLGTVAYASTYVVPNFSNTTVLYRMGRAHHELAAQTTPLAMLPDPTTQYGQFFMAMIQESTFQKMTKKEVQWSFSDLERMNIFDMKRGMEESHLWGAGGYLTNPDDTSQKIYTTNGITRRISNALEYGTSTPGNRTVSFSNVIDWAKGVFVGNSGSDSRYLFAGADLIGSLHSVETIQKQVNGKSPVVKWGINFTEIVTNFGTLYVRHHPLFDESGWIDRGLILDFEHIRKYDFQPMQVRDLDLKTPGLSNSDARVISEASFTTLAYPECHAIIKPQA